jgi:two-component system, LytTR family, response regulator
MSIRTVIVDDEPWARTRIATLLSSEEDFEVVAACASGDEAISAVTTLAPHVVFLDVQMPGLDGFEVVDAVGVEAMPIVVFATAHDDYALKAFEAQALDYLLKPFDEERFRRTVRRVRREVESHAKPDKSLERLMQTLRGERRYLQRLTVQAAGRVTFLKSLDIDWLEASGNYVTLHVGRDTHLLRDSLTALEEKLDPNQFIRVHRSAIVNIERIKELAPWVRGEQALILRDGTQLTIGRAFRTRLTSLISNSTD